MEGGREEQMNITNGWEYPALLRLSFGDSMQDLGVSLTAA
jgi:hypothetical protein